MALDDATVEWLFRAGRFGDILRGVDTSTEALSRSGPIHQLRVAQALAHADRLDEARRIAQVVGARADERTRAHSELLLGLIAKREGPPELAAKHFQAAIRLARDAGATVLAAWAHLQLFRLLAERDSHEELSALLAEARQLVTRAGDPHLASYLHASVALRDAQTGRLNEARRHLSISASLLERDPNAWIQQLTHITMSCVASLDCDAKMALSEAEAARMLSATTGSTYQDPVINVNQAHFELWIGKLKTALTRLHTASTHRRRAIRIAALDGIAQLYLLINRLDECEAALTELSLALSGQHSSFWSYRWVACTRIGLLMLRGKTATAIREVEPEIGRALRVSDTPLAIALLLLQAQGMAQLRRFEESGAALTRAMDLGALNQRDQLGSFYETCHRVLEGTSTGNAFRDRAFRVWRTQGNISGQLAALSRTGPPLEVGNYTQAQVDKLMAARGPKQTGVQSEPSHAVLNGIAAAFDLASDPTLSGRELMSVANVVSCDDVVEFVDHPSVKPVDNKQVTQSGVVRLRTMSLNPERSILVGSILRIAQAVEAVRAARDEEARRTALWPAEEAVERDGLFLSEEMRSLAATARKVAPTTVPVLITGETGTGKEILARAIHAASTRATATFLPFNCAAGPKEMIDSQLFGHRRGAFTGALEHAPGVVRTAAGGTLFLDEIGEAPLDVQPKLLRFLESGEIHPVGEPQPIRIDVRVIAATNLDLDAAVSSGRFREDLFYRLNIVRLHVPPLRERRVEIPVFAQHYLQKHARELAKGDLRLAEETMEYLLLYKWPGNIRQLANEMRRLAALAESDAVLMPEHLSSEIVASRRTVPASQRTLEAHELVVRLDQPLAAATEHLERSMLQYALKMCGGRVEDTARRLGLSRKGLYLKRMRLGLELPTEHARSA